LEAELDLHDTIVEPAAQRLAEAIEVDRGRLGHVEPVRGLWWPE
jgi:hypothetical protein